MRRSCVNSDKLRHYDDNKSQVRKKAAGYPRIQNCRTPTSPIGPRAGAGHGPSIRKYITEGRDEGGRVNRNTGSTNRQTDRARECKSANRPLRGLKKLRNSRRVNFARQLALEMKYKIYSFPHLVELYIFFFGSSGSW